MTEITNFSSGYYLIEGLDVEESDGISIPEVDEKVYAEIQDEYYGTDASAIVMKHNDSNVHFQVEPSSYVGNDSISVPSCIFESMNIIGMPRRESFLLAKPIYAQLMVDMKQLEGGV